MNKKELVYINEKQKRFLIKYLENRKNKYGENYTYTFDPQNNFETVKVETVIKDIIENEGHVLFRGTPEQLSSIYRGENEDESLYNCYPAGSLNMDDILDAAAIISLGDKDLGVACFKVEKKDAGVFGHYDAHYEPTNTHLYMSHYETFGNHNYINPVVMIETTDDSIIYTYLDGAKYEIY